MQEHLEQDQMWSIMDSFYKEKGLNHMALESFNYFLEHDLQKIVSNTEPIIISTKKKEYMESKRYTITFEQVYITKPSINDNNYTVDIIPQEARWRSLSYDSPLHLDIRTVIEHQAVSSEEWTIISDTTSQEYIARLPMMLRSKYCHSYKDKNDKNEKNYKQTRSSEPDSDLGGYFIINGAEKVVVTQERNANNLIYAFKNRDKRAFIVETRSQLDPLKIAITLKCFLSDGNVYLQLSNSTTFLPIGSILKALGVSDSDLINILLYSCKDSEERETFHDLLRSSLIESSVITDRESAYYYIGSELFGKNSPRLDKISHTKNVIDRDLLPHMHLVMSDIDLRKAYFIGFMTVKLLRISLGLIDEDDRDNYANRRLDTPGILMSSLFKELFDEYRVQVMTICNHQLSKGPEQYNVSIASKSTLLTTGLSLALRTGNWGLKNSTHNRLGVSQELGRLTSSATISHLRRVNMPLDRSNKQTGPRHLHNTQFGYFCPAETPEGPACGLIKALALTCCCSYDTSPNEVISTIWQYIHDTTSTTTTTTMTCVFVNGAYIGSTYHEKDIISSVKTLRKNKESTISIAHVPNNRTIMIFTDAGRITRPLLIVSNNELHLTQNDLKLEWSDLISKNLVEMIDVREEDTLLIAMELKNLEQPNTHLYTHAEIHPALILGTSASSIPFPHHNPSPRNGYAAGMGKQALGIYANNYPMRFDSAVHNMWYLQKPMAGTKAMDYTKYNQSPGGMNTIVAIAVYSGYNQEDSLIMSKGAVDRGLFRSTYYRKYVTSEENEEFSTECIEVPEKDKVSKLQPGSYAKIDATGIIVPDTAVSSGDILVGKTSSSTRKIELKKDTSLGLKSSDYGITDKVMYSNDAKGNKMVKVKLRSVRTPQVGDKFASRSSQKGTVGNLFSQEDLPFTADGIVPDIIVNPHAIPSRMTLGHLIECLISKKGALLGSTQDTTAFNPITVEEIGEELHKHGYEKYGFERLMHGHTGKRIDALIFIGPTYYQRLKHMVDDKIYSRARGPLVQLTRQPMHGKSAKGGLRVGEMERDGLISHGVANFMRDRLFINSDLYRIHVCKKCGVMVDVTQLDPKDARCRSCKSAEIYQVFLPYACKLVFQELMSMLILPRLMLE